MGQNQSSHDLSCLSHTVLSKKSKNPLKLSFNTKNKLKMFSASSSVSINIT